MNRRELLKNAAIVPLAALGVALTTESAEAAVGQIGTVTDVFPGGYGPESFNGGDLVVKIAVIEAAGVKEHEIIHGLVHKKTKIYFNAQKVKYREFRDEVYYNHEAILKALVGVQVILLFSNSPYGKLKSIDFNTNPL